MCLITIPQGLGFLNFTPSGTHRLAHITPHGARIGLGALAARREALAVPSTAIRADVFEPLNVTRYFALEITLDLEALERGTDSTLFLGSERIGAFGGVHASFFANAYCAWHADTIERGERV